MKGSEWRQCGKKKRYKSEHDVGVILKKCEKERGQKLDYYYCVYCKGWHLTSNDDMQPGVDHTRWTGKNGDIIKDKYCIGCADVLTCKGKPRGVINCINYKGSK